MTKKNLMMRIASVLLIAVILTTSVIGGTLAKYTSTATGTNTFTVAKWSFKVNDKDIAKADGTSYNADFNIFSTIVDTVDGNVDEEVGANLIAPGTKGSFDIKLENASQVDAEYKLTFDTADLASLPFVFTYKVGSADYTPSDEFIYIDAGASKTITVSWEWPFYTSADQDILDTADGISAINGDVSFTIIAQQRD